MARLYWSEPKTPITVPYNDIVTIRECCWGQLKRLYEENQDILKFSYTTFARAMRSEAVTEENYEQIKKLVSRIEIAHGVQGAKAVRVLTVNMKRYIKHPTRRNFLDLKNLFNEKEELLNTVGNRWSFATADKKS